MKDHSTSMLDGFDYQPRTRILFGQDSLDQLGDCTRPLHATRILLVTDKHIVAAGHVDRVVGLLEDAGLSVVIYDEVNENPTTQDVDRCLGVAQQGGIDCIVGLGGGSSLDTAKGCNFLLTNGGKMEDYRGRNKAKKEMLPFIAIPTTAGTGSECQSYALIADARSHQKMACGDKKAAARVAILEPALTLTQPRIVTISTGIDAITHAVESAVTQSATELSTMFSRQAFRLTVNHFDRVLNTCEDIEARARMQLGAAYGGIAIENSMLGAAHAAANPLTARFDVVHGQAVGLMLPAVIRFNCRKPAIKKSYADLSVYASLANPADSVDQAIDALLRRIDELWELAKLPRSLEEFGVDESAIGDLATEAADQWTAKHNPVSLAAEDFVGLYQQVFTRAERSSGVEMR